MSTVAPPRPAAPPRAAPPPPPSRRWPGLPWRSAEAKAAPRDDLATLCLFLVSVAVAFSVGRLFRGATWVPYGLAAATLGHGLAWALRRLGLGLVTASLSSAFLSLLVAIELVLPQATTYGFPTPFTFASTGQALTQAQASFRTAVPPVAPSPGFLVAAVVGVCMCAFLADWAAFRMRTAFEACVPGLGLFVFTSVLGAKSHRGLAVAAFALATLVFLIVQRANLEGGQTAWFGGRDRGALPSLLATGALLGAVAVVGALVLSPMVPGAGSKPLLSFKKGGGGGSGTSSRSTVSPLVDIQSRLRQYNNVEVFTVRSEQPAYWRLTSLDQFDGTIWSSNERYASNRGQLTPSTGLSGTELVQEVTVSGLASIWLPAAYRPAAVEGVSGLSYSPGSASLITRKDTSNGLSYKVTSVLPDLDPGQLRRAPPSGAGRSELGEDYQRYTAVGGPVSPRVRQLAAQLASGSASPYDRALAIQDHFLSGRFRYSLEVPAGHSGSAIDRFLFQNRVGYCEQFAGSYAVLARLMGLPTRVAVGFQPGADQGGTFSVQDKDAHAWPEVYFEGVGWTAFEPTPGRGNPQAQDYTGVPYSPEVQRPEVTAPTTTAAPPTTTGPDGAASTPVPDEAEANLPEDPVAEDDGLWSGVLSVLRRAAPLWITLAGVGGLLAGSAALVAGERRSRRRRAGGSAEARIHMAWEESLEALAGAGVRARPAETVTELMHRLSAPAGGAALAGVERGTAAHSALVRLGDAVVETAYTGRNAPTALAGAAEADRSAVVSACRNSQGRWSRLRADIDPRPALARLRAARTANRPPPTEVD